MPTNGYAGYAPGANSRMPNELTDLERHFRALPLESSEDTLAIIDKLTRNIVRNPAEQKFRRINLTNAKIKAAIADVPNAIGLLEQMGWVQEEGALVLPPGARLSHEVHVIGIIDAQDYYKEQMKKEKERQTRAAKDIDPEVAKLKAQLEADRKEKAAEGPITKGSVATKRGNGVHMTAGDLGIGKGGG